MLSFSWMTLVIAFDGIGRQHALLVLKHIGPTSWLVLFKKTFSENDSAFVYPKATNSAINMVATPNRNVIDLETGVISDDDTSSSSDCSTKF